MKQSVKKPFNGTEVLSGFKTKLVKRYERASLAYRAALKADEGEISMEAKPAERIVGLVEDIETGRPESLCLGENQFLEAKIQVTQKAIHLLTASQSKELFHGEVFEVGGRNYRLGVLSPRSIGKYFFATLLFTVARLLPVSAEESESLKLVAKKDFSIDFHLPGKGQLEADTILMNIFGDEETARLDDVSVGRKSERLEIFVDVSGLCVQRNMEGVINTGLSDFLSKLAGSTIVSVSEFYQDADGTEIYRRKVDEQDADQLSDRKNLISCQEGRRSLNALSVFQRLSDIEKNTSFLVISSGNIREVEGLSSQLEENRAKLVVALYSPRLTTYAEDVLKSSTGARGGNYFIWQQDEVLSLSKNYPYLWRFHFSNKIPVSWEAKSYSYEVVMSGEALMSGSLRYEKNLLRLILYWSFVVLVALLCISLALLLGRALIRYYRKPICHTTGKTLSRTWNGSLFSAKGRFPVLIVFRQGVYVRSQVLDSGSLRVGPSFTSGLRLRFRGSDAGLLIEELAEKCFEIQSLGDDSLVINGMRKSGRHALQKGDCIQWGPYSLHFCYADAETEEKEAA